MDDAPATPNHPAPPRKATCLVPECDRPSEANGVCKSCYQAGKYSNGPKGVEVRKHWTGPREATKRPRAKAKAKAAAPRPAKERHHYPLDPETRKAAEQYNERIAAAGLAPAPDRSPVADARIALATELATALGIERMAYQDGFILTHTAKARRIYLDGSGRLHPVEIRVGEAR
jgi:hypothetical protein